MTIYDIDKKEKKTLTCEDDGVTRNDANCGKGGGKVSEFCDVNELNHYTDILLPNLLHGGIQTYYFTCISQYFCLASRHMGVRLTLINVSPHQIQYDDLYENKQGCD